MLSWLAPNSFIWLLLLPGIDPLCPRRSVRILDKGDANGEREPASQETRCTRREQKASCCRGREGVHVLCLDSALQTPRECLLRPCFILQLTSLTLRAHVLPLSPRSHDVSGLKRLGAWARRPECLLSAACPA